MSPLCRCETQSARDLPPPTWTQLRTPVIGRPITSTAGLKKQLPTTSPTHCEKSGEPHDLPKHSPRRRVMITLRCNRVRRQPRSSEIPEGRRCWQSACEGAEAYLGAQLPRCTQACLAAPRHPLSSPPCIPHTTLCCNRQPHRVLQD